MIIIFTFIRIFMYNINTFIMVIEKLLTLQQQFRLKPMH
jgi:hypothetical protein